MMVMMVMMVMAMLAITDTGGDGDDGDGGDDGTTSFFQNNLHVDVTHSRVYSTYTPPLLPKGLLTRCCYSDLYEFVVHPPV